MVNPTAALRQSEGGIGLFIECCANWLLQGSMYVHTIKTLITALNFNGELAWHCDVFNFDFRAIVTFGQDPKDGKEGKQMMFKVRFHVDCHCVNGSWLPLLRNNTTGHELQKGRINSF